MDASRPLRRGAVNPVVSCRPASIDFRSLESARPMLEKTNAFVPADEADEEGTRLQLPTAELLAR
jgi:hypothetical protein